jgi:hypothetical protein
LPGAKFLKVLQHRSEKLVADSLPPDDQQQTVLQTAIMIDKKLEHRLELLTARLIA